jgi:amino acid adenylation domain-containing protein
MSSDTFSGQRRLLLQELLSGRAAAHRAPSDAVQPREPGQPVPVSAEQKHVWFHGSMAPDVPLYNEAVTIHRNGSFSLHALERAFNAVLSRHEMWRSSIEMRDGRLLIVVKPDLELKLPLVDLTDRPEEEREAAALHIATEDARIPFDLACAPLLRARVVRLAPDRHRLYLVLHHIIFDGVSIYRLIVPELSALYAAYAAGKEPNLTASSLQYGDYAIWREQQLGSKAIAQQLKYWREQLSGELPELQLPADRNPPSAPTHRGTMETFQLCSDLTNELKKFSRGEGVTLYVTLLAAFKTMLYRWSGQEDIVIGGVTDMRHRPELEKVVGYFLNSVALRTRPRAVTTFRDYLHEVQRTVIEALDASDVPFDRVVREIAVKRDGRRHPLFQVLFSIEPPIPDFPDGWELTQMDVAIGTAKFDLYLELDEKNGRTIGRFLYDVGLFEAPTIRRMIGHWQTLLRGIIQDPQCALAKLPMLTPEEHREIFLERNQTAQDYPNATLYTWIEEVARHRPEAVAVECASQAWRYSELMGRTDAIASLLAEAGATRGSLIGIAFERSLEMVAGLLAIHKIGSAYLPLDPELPEARLRLLIGGARPMAILTDRSGRAKLPLSDAAVLVCDDTPIAKAADRVVPPSDSDDLAYVLYTSGSAGEPKAVEIRHRSVVNLLAAVQRDLEFGPRDTLLALTTLSFDIAALEIFLPLVSGGKLVLARTEESRDPSRLAALIASSGCTMIQATPATWRALLATGWNGDPRLTILCGGEALARDLAAALLQRCGALWNMYGPTETTIWSLRHKVGPGEEEVVPIGRPLANTRVYILDDNDAPVPDLVPGELLIAGDGLARGYRNDPELTAKKFVASSLPRAERLYRTGDRARYRPDGAIEFLGRTDNQVKIRGFRIGVEEVESALAAHPSVAACAVRASADRSGELCLTAYLTGSELSASDIPAVRDSLRATLPAYMVPTKFTILAALPMTPNGKIDRKKLSDPQISGSGDTVEPRDELETELATIWKKVLDLSEISIHDNFFDLGGHSLLVSVLVAEIQTALGFELPLETLFSAPTIACLAQRLRSETGPVFSYLVPLRPGIGRPIFIVHSIFGIVLGFKEFAERLSTTRPVYGIQARGADPRQQPHENIAEMVEAYVEAIRSVQPNGPYALAGFCFGGLVAFEMACYFRAQGEVVDLLAMLETDLSARYLPWRDKLDYLLLLFEGVLNKLRRLPPPMIPSYLLRNVLQLGHRALLRLGLRRDFVNLVWPRDYANIVGPMAQRYIGRARNQQMYAIGAREFVSFQPKPYDGKLSVFRASDASFGTCDPMPIWRRVTKNIELFQIDGGHSTILDKPYVATLAAQFSRCLIKYQELADPRYDCSTAVLTPPIPLLLRD